MHAPDARLTSRLGINGRKNRETRVWPPACITNHWYPCIHKDLVNEAAVLAAEQLGEVRVVDRFDDEGKIHSDGIGPTVATQFESLGLLKDRSIKTIAQPPRWLHVNHQVFQYRSGVSHEQSASR
jgi:hypothetical protein